MPNGFIGPAALSYLTHVDDANSRTRDSVQNISERTTNVSSNVSAQVGGNGTITRITNSAATSLNRTANMREFNLPGRLPFDIESARAGSGRHITGVNNSTNIVSNIDDYNAISRQLADTNDRIGHCVYQMALEVEEMCSTIFIMPGVAERCLNVCAMIKDCLVKSRATTDDICMVIKRFAQELDAIE